MPTIHHFPAWTENPYANMLYLGARSEGWIVEGSVHVDDLAVAARSLVNGDILHIHWTDPICQAHTSPETARASLDRFLATLDRALGDRIRVLWTVHAITPPRTRYPDLEVELVRFLAAVAERIVVLNAHTREALAGMVELPTSKLVRLRHASYNGIYAPAPAQSVARECLGLGPEAAVVGVVGEVRSPHSIRHVAAALARIKTEVPELALAIAGRYAKDEEDRLDQLESMGIAVVRRPGWVPSTDLGMWITAPDVIVLPDTGVLNSGRMLLSATFGRPCIVPAERHLVAEFGDQPWVGFFEPTLDPSVGLGSGITYALTDAHRVREAAGAFAAEYTTISMAWDFLSIIAAARPDGSGSSDR